ncbi:MAG: dihydrolipoyl dehydrogenase [Nanoarchaeota archaeon]
MVQSFELMVIGGGTGGLRTALYAASHGKKTVMIEPGTIGGTCLNFGCIPTKALLQSVHIYHSVLNAKEFGVNTGKVSFSFKGIMKRMKDIVQDGQDHIKGSLKNPNLTVVRKSAKFLSSNTIQAGNDVYYADKIVIATGSKSTVFPIPGLKESGFMTSDDVLKLEKLPKSLLIIGGGYISMELATFFNGLGCKVTILERLPRCLAVLDQDITDYLTKGYEEEGVEIHTNVNILQIKKQKGKVVIETNDVRDAKSKKSTYKADKLLLSVGRSPNTDGLNLEAAGVKLDGRKYIEVNQFMLTSNPNIYAIGDVNGKGPFAHGAKRQSKVCLEHLFGGESMTINYDLMPYAVFTDPPIAGVGLGEQQAKDKGYDVGILKAEFKRAGRATIIGDTRGFVKVVYDKKTDKIVGAFIIGPNADDLIHEFVVLMNSASPTVDVIRDTIHIHPTLAEVMEALKIVS